MDMTHCYVIVGACCCCPALHCDQRNSPRCNNRTLLVSPQTTDLTPRSSTVDHQDREVGCVFCWWRQADDWCHLCREAEHQQQMDGQFHLEWHKLASSLIQNYRLSRRNDDDCVTSSQHDNVTQWLETARLTTYHRMKLTDIQTGNQVYFITIPVYC